MKRKLKVAIIGAGRIAGLLQEDPLRRGIVTHAAAYQSFPKLFEISACASRNEENARRFAEKFSIPHFYTDYRKMLAKQKPDVVSICAFTESRYEMIRASVGAGVRGIFCEKPLAPSLEEADKIIALCRRKKVVLSVNHTRRWGADLRTIKKEIATGRFGKIQNVTASFSGSLFHTGTHLFDSLQFLFGKPKSVTGWLETKEKKGRRFLKGFQDFDGTALFLFDHGIRAAVFGLPKKYFIFEMDIQGTHGRMRAGNFLWEAFQTAASPHYTGFSELQKTELGRIPLPVSGLALAVRDLWQGIQRRKVQISTGEDGRDALEMAFAVVESSVRRNREVRLPLANRKRRILAR